MNFSKYVEDKKKELRKKNIEEVRQEIKSGWVQKKINNYLLSNPCLFTKEDIEENILNNDIVASFFGKDPSRQNLSEKLCAEVLHLKSFLAMGKIV